MELRPHPCAAEEHLNQKLAMLSIEGASEMSAVSCTPGSTTRCCTQAVLGVRPLLQRLRRPGARWSFLHGLFALDTFRAENTLVTILSPERIDDMVRALLQDYQQGGWMPKWPNPSYTNIMIATHADSVVAEAINKAFTALITAWRTTPYTRTP